MIIACPSCSKRYKIPDERLEGRRKLTVRCPNCKALIEAVPPQDPEAAGQPKTEPPSSTMTQTLKKIDSTHSSDGQALPDDLEMPEGQRISLAVLQGADAGKIFPVEKALFLIGRENTDAVLKDSEISRRHAQIEIKPNQIVLRDLLSTNGTYVNEERITSMVIENQSEFRVGSTTLLLIVTDYE